MSWPSAFGEAIQSRLWQRKCATCNISWYEHHDHTHSMPCAFGDCGEFKERVDS